MLRNLPRNLIPKFNTLSKTPSKIFEIIEEVLKKPIIIPNYLNKDTPFIDYNEQISPYDINKSVCKYQYVDKLSLDRHFNNYQKKKVEWENTSFKDRKDIFLKAADLIETKYYDRMLAYTMVGQNKNIYEAEIDSICELVDFLRFNISYTENILEKQPISTYEIDNISEYNSLNGFVASITPFNFTAIGGNLASAPLLFGNSVLWKPSDNAILSNHLFYEIMLEAGLPEGVLNFCPMEPEIFLDNISARNDLGALLFTGSSGVFDNIHKKVLSNLEDKKVYPRIIGETGGKNFHFLDTSSSNKIDEIVNKTIESTFNYSGQKCSACSIMYVPDFLLNYVEKSFQKNIDIYMNNLQNYGLINNKSYTKTSNLVKDFYNDNNLNIIVDPKSKNENSYYITPKILICEDHDHDVFNKEFFSPILAIYPYSCKEQALELCANQNSYSLTGSIFSEDNKFIEYAKDKLKHKTGNFYINDKSTGSVVGQQPFGGSGKSGTNDKAGDINLLFRLFNQRNIKVNKFF